MLKINPNSGEIMEINARWPNAGKPGATPPPNLIEYEGVIPVPGEHETLCWNAENQQVEVAPDYRGVTYWLAWDDGPHVISVLGEVPPEGAELERPPAPLATLREETVARLRSEAERIITRRLPTHEQSNANARAIGLLAQKLADIQWDDTDAAEMAAIRTGHRWIKAVRANYAAVRTQVMEAKTRGALRAIQVEEPAYPA